MSYGPELDTLAVRWAEEPASTCFAALAEGLRKSGALPEAAAVASRGITLSPDYLPGHLVLARIYRDQQRWEAADRELRVALDLDPSHPVVLEAREQLARLGEVAPPLPVATTPPVLAPEPDDDESQPREAMDLVYTDTLVDAEASTAGESVLTESLAMLYWRQGHLERAVEVFDTLVTRQPENHALAVHRDAARAQLDSLRPPPYDAAASGGRPVRDWLSSLAAVKAPPAPPASSFDAFYQTAAAPPAESGDFAAFQAWLRELDR